MSANYRCYLENKCNELDSRLEKAIKRYDRAVDDCDGLEIYRADRDVKRVERESDYWYARLESHLGGRDHWDF